MGGNGGSWFIYLDTDSLLVRYFIKMSFDKRGGANVDMSQLLGGDGWRRYEAGADAACSMQPGLRNLLHDQCNAEPIISFYDRWDGCYHGWPMAWMGYGTGCKGEGRSMDGNLKARSMLSVQAVS